MEQIDYLIKITSSPTKEAVDLAVWSHDTLVESIEGPPENVERVLQSVTRLMNTTKRACYDFDEMNAGEIKIIPTEDPRKVQSAAYVHGRRHGRKYRCWTLTNGKVRVRRVS